MNLTFNELPKAVGDLLVKLDNIERLLLQKLNKQQGNDDCWFDLTELCNYLPDKPTKATVYGWVHACGIPYHKGQKKLRFLRSEIDQWLMNNEKKEVKEIAEEAHSYLIQPKRRRKFYEK